MWWLIRKDHKEPRKGREGVWVWYGRRMERAAGGDVIPRDPSPNHSLPTCTALCGHLGQGPKVLPQKGESEHLNVWRKRTPNRCKRRSWTEFSRLVAISWPFLHLQFLGHLLRALLCYVFLKSSLLFIVIKSLWCQLKIFWSCTAPAEIPRHPHVFTCWVQCLDFRHWCARYNWARGRL